MRLNLAAAICVAFSVILAGCATGGGRPNPSSTTHSGSVDATATSTSTTTATPGPISATGIPRSISWNECHGTGVAIPYGQTLLGMDHGETPPGWDPQTGDNSMYQVMVNVCQRVSVGNIERGPVSFMLEDHWGIDPPDSCRDFEGGFFQAATLLSLWVDDPEVVALLRDQLHMPVVQGEAHVETMQQGDAEIQTWTFKAEGGDESKIVVSHPGGHESPGAPVMRFVWHNETGVSFYDMAEDTLLPDVPAPTAQGVLAPPLRYAAAAPTPIAGLTSVWKNKADFYGPIYRFGDMQCKQPL